MAYSLRPCWAVNQLGIRNPLVKAASECGRVVTLGQDYDRKLLRFYVTHSPPWAFAELMSSDAFLLTPAFYKFVRR